MAMYLLENILWNPNIIKYSLLLGLSVLICLVAYLILQIIHKYATLTFDEYIPIEQTVVSLLVAIWSFGLFCLPFALILWICFYFIYSDNRVVKYVLENSSKAYNPRIMEKHFRVMPHKTLLKSIFQEKEKAKGCFKTSPKSCYLPKRRLPIRIYLSGIIVYFVLSMIEKNTLSNSNFISLIFLDNLIAFFGLFYAIYLLLYLIGVRHWLGDWHHLPHLFDAFAVFFLLIGIVIVVAITFYY